MINQMNRMKEITMKNTHTRILWAKLILFVLLPPRKTKASLKNPSGWHPGKNR